MPSLTRNGVVALVSGLALVSLGAATSYEEMTLLGAAPLAALLLGVLCLLGRPRFEVHRAIAPDRVFRGEPAFGSLSITNHGRSASATLTAIDLVGGQPVVVELPRVARGGTATKLYALPTSKRGAVAVGPLVIQRSDPLGLVTRKRELGERLVLRVHPKPIPMRVVRRGRHRSLEGVNNDRAEGSLTFHALKEYVRGDDLRHVHWRSSARLWPTKRTLMIKEHVDTSQPRTTVLVDLRHDRWDADALDEAMDVVASIVMASARKRFPVRVVTSDGEQLEARSRAGTQATMDRLATLQPGRSLAVSVAGSRLPRDARDALVVVGGPFDDEDLRSMGALSRRFASTAAVSIRADARRRPTPHPCGVAVFDGVTAEDVVSAWERSR